MSGKAAVKTRRSFFVIAILVAVILVITLVFLVQRYYAGLNQQLFTERRDHLTEFTEKTAELISKSNENAVNQLEACAYALSHSDGETETDEAACLTYLKGLVGNENTLVLLFDARGNYYASDGATGYWEESDLLQNTGDAVNIGVMSCPHEGDVTRMIYARKLEEPLTLSEGGETITHIALALNSEEFKSEMSVTAYGETGFTFLTNSKGRRIYQYEYNNNNNNNNTFLGGYNLIHAIESCPVLHKGSCDSLTAAIEAHETDAYEFTYTDEETGEKTDWFVGLSYIDNADWIVLLLVPTESLGQGTASLLSDTAGFFMMIAAGLVIIFVLVFLVLMRSRSDQRLLAQQEASNKLLQEAADKAEAASRAKTEFLSHMSHDIRTPINAIMGMTGIAMKNTGDEERVRDCLGKIDGSSQHLLSLVNDVLDMSRIESGKTTLNYEAFNLKKCLNNCASIISGQLVDRQVTLIRDFDRITSPAVIGDELHLRQVFINILGNSVKFTPDGGSIAFRAWEEEKEGQTLFVFDLSDTGIGMSKEYLPRLFEAFSQEAGGSRTTYKGTGLGMAITKRFVDLMGGSIEVESELNKGTRFLLKIPMEITALPEEKEITAEDFTALKGLKVLLAEDNELNAEILLDTLEEAGMTVTAVTDGKAALEAFEASEKGQYDLILMDMQMPVMDGITATKEIRGLEREDAKTILILAMTANSIDEAGEAAEEAGMSGFLMKPLQVEEIRKYLGKTERRKGS